MQLEANVSKNGSEIESDTSQLWSNQFNHSWDRWRI